MLVSINRERTSFWLLIFTCTLVILAGLSSDFFQSSTKVASNLGKAKSVIAPEEIEEIKTLEINNRLGRFVLEKAPSGWHLTYPRNLNANVELVDRILDALKNIKIRTFFPRDAINLGNFSLDTPLMSFKLIGPNDEKQLVVGLVNPIDESTYITYGERPAIYQVQTFSQGFEGLKLPDFVDPRIFTLSAQNVLQVSLESSIGGNQFREKLYFKKNEKNEWLSRQGQILAADKVQAFLEELKMLRSQTILDERSSDLQESIDKLLAFPLFKIGVTIENNKTINYRISGIINTLPDVRIEKNNFFLIEASNRKHPFLVDKKHLDLFKEKSDQLFK